jgi:hypothetical protein
LRPPRPNLRTALSLLSLLSLLPLLAVLGLWARSHFVEDQVIWRRADGGRWVVTSSGHLVFGEELVDWSGWPALGLQYTRADPLPPADHVVRMWVLSVGPRDTFERWTGYGGFG